MTNEAPDYHVDFNQLDWESPMLGVRHKRIVRGDMTLRLVEYGLTMEAHWCEVAHVGQILTGNFEIEFDSGIHIFRAGDGVMIPGGAAHRHRARVVDGDKVSALFVETP